MKNRYQLGAVKRYEAEGKLKNFEPTLLINGELRTVTGVVALGLLGSMSEAELDRDWGAVEAAPAETPDPDPRVVVEPPPAPDVNPVGPGGGEVVTLTKDDILEIDVGDLVKGPASEAVEAAAAATDEAAKAADAAGEGAEATVETAAAANGEPEVGDDGETDKAAPGSSS